MALLDSGMGWSADENFMRQSSGKLADLAALVGGPIIPYAATPSDAVANGLLLFHRLDQNYEYYAAVSSPEMIAVCGSYTWQTNNRYFCAFGLANTITVNVYKYNYVTQVATLDQTKQLRTACTIGGTTPAYYVTIAMPNWGDGTWFTPNPEIDNYSTLADLENAISYSATPFYKLNSGYATGCLLKWRSMPSDTVYVSPVLISSSSDNTLLSIDGTTAAPTVSNRHLYQGMWFALRYSTAYNTGDFTNATFPIRDITDTPVYGSDGLFARLAQMVSLTVTDAPDPYGGDAAEEGGDGSDPEDDPVDEETMSLPSVAGLGFCSVYVPSQSELLSLSAYLWSGNFDLNSIIKLFSNPMDSIIGLSAVPVDLAGSPQSIRPSRLSALAP